MTMVGIPGTLNFLATQRFYPGFNSARCRIVKETFNGHGWDQTIIGDFPYIHRFDIIPQVDNQNFWYIGCSIANSKKNTDDWSDPGKIWVGEYDDKQEKIINLHSLNTRITKNHGYRRMKGYSLITGAEGIYQLNHPTNTSDWQLKQLSSFETSDIAAADINQDGQIEYLAIEGFHGTDLRIYDHDFQTLAHSKTLTPFGHAIWGGKINQQEYFLFGWRADSQGLELITDANLSAELIAQNVGPSNVTVYEKSGQQYLLSANREANEVAIYRISE
ncbi:hypothetical protein EQ500_03330 [Lactobacillus sp. XV13L]|nr:hypothetical protein [Lactobacillus sp. XV13L]